MKDLSQCEAREAYECLAPLLCRSLLLRDDESAAQLSLFFHAVNEGDLLLSLKAYHDFSAALFTAPARRVSGNLWQDYLLYILLEKPNPFSRRAAASRLDEASLAMLKEELSILGALSTLSDELLIRFAQSRGRALKLKPRQARDNIEMFSNAVWSGGSARSLPTPSEQQQSAGFSFNGELEFTSLCYGEASLCDHYVCDEALEEIYARLLEKPDWAAQLEDLRCFFSSYGCGIFLRTRALRFYQGSFCELKAEVLRPLAEPVCFPKEHEQIMENVIRFMQGDARAHMLLCGGAGMGKSAQIFSVVYELPEARLVMADEKEDLFALFALLSEQPLKFVLLFDGVSPNALPSSAFCVLPENVLVVVTTRSQSETLEWAQRIVFPSLSGEAFHAFVEDLLESSYVICESTELHNACVDAQVDARSHLSVASALRLAERFRVQGT